MIAFAQDGITLYRGDVRERLADLEAGSFNTCVTSPPYFGLRDYGVDGQLGLEPTPEQYVANMVDVFREVRRCLRDDGTLWLNIGDSYAGSWGARGRGEGTNAARPDLEVKHGTDCPARNGFPGIKPKDLIGIPWMLAFALRADGWYLRSDIIWAKGLSFCPGYAGSVMPESVTDRPTKGHEYLFLLSKSADYFCDMEAIKDASIYPDDVRAARETEYHLAAEGISRLNPKSAKAYPKRNVRTVWAINPGNYAGAHFATFPEDLVIPCIKAGSPEGGNVLEPFAGSGTTLKVARDLGRRATGIELNPAYCEIIKRRFIQPLLFVPQNSAAQ
ncbi:MAG TPA: site-specific DNA-methyltransferase [Tepidisphaeraceae bacterium]|nr:site-specific DNA-methyltransferase [Tepidisphaeraceae bacterium]